MYKRQLLFLAWWEGLLLPRHLHIESEPKGAWVLVEGRPVGRTPDFDLRLPRRTAAIQLELDGYYPFPYTLKPADSALKVNLAPLALYLTFDTRPSGAQVYVNGRPVGITPVKDLRVRNDLRGAALLVKREGYVTYGTTLGVGKLPPALIVLEPRKGTD